MMSTIQDQIYNILSELKAASAVEICSKLSDLDIYQVRTALQVLVKKKLIKVIFKRKAKLKAYGAKYINIYGTVK